MKNTVLALLICVLMPTSVLANNSPPLPDPTSGWSMKYRTDLTIKVDLNGQTYTIYLGFTEHYLSLTDDSEHLIVVKRFVPIAEPDLQDLKNNDRLIRNQIIHNYQKKLYQDYLNKMYKEADPIIYVKHKISYDRWTNDNVLNMPSEAWLYSQQSGWVFQSGQPIDKESFSEPGTNNLKKTTLIGIKYSIGEYYHILTFDQAELWKYKEKK